MVKTDLTIRCSNRRILTVLQRADGNVFIQNRVSGIAARSELDYFDAPCPRHPSGHRISRERILQLFADGIRNVDASKIG